MANHSMKVWEGTVLTVPNHHTESCGKPPGLRAEGCYTAYFENRYGEQMVFQFDYESKKGALRHGDYSWEEPVAVMAGGTTLVLDEDEREWLRIVWKVATEHEPRSFQLRSALELNKAWRTIYDNLLTRAEFADDAFMRRDFLKQIKRLQKEEKALADRLIQTQIDETAEGKPEDGTH